MDDFEKTLQAHDKQIGLIASSVESMLRHLEKTNDKIDDIYKAVNKQSILAEKLFNLESTTSGNFVRLNQKISAIEKALTDENGCAVAKYEKQRLDTVVSNLVSTSTTLNEVEKVLPKKLNSTVAYTLFVLFLGYLIAFGVYIEQTGHTMIEFLKDQGTQVFYIKKKKAA
jgi:Mg2+ and Co2+ transporter CorA